MPKNSNKKILLTGFAPFNNDTINPSWEVVKKLQGKKINGTRIIGMRLPVVFGKAGRLVINAIKKYQPELVISLGQYTGVPLILIERVGLNIHIGRDENKIKPKNKFIIPGGTTAYFVRLPFKSIISKLKKKGIPVNISFNAGTHLCNEVLYTTLDYVATHKLPRQRRVCLRHRDSRDYPLPTTKVGFIHIPMLPVRQRRICLRHGVARRELLPKQVARRDKPYPSMSLETLVKGVRLIIEGCLNKSG